MINYKITLAKELGRVPNEHEIGQKMLEVVSNHPKLKRKEKENKILASSMAIQRNKEEANKHRRKDTIQASPRVRMINKMLQHNLNVHQISDILDLQVSTVQDTIFRYKLPRDEVVLIPSKTGRRQI